MGRFGGVCQTQAVRDASRIECLATLTLDNDSTLKCLRTPARVGFAHTTLQLRFMSLRLFLLCSFQLSFQATYEVSVMKIIAERTLINSWENIDILGSNLDFECLKSQVDHRFFIAFRKFTKRGSISVV